jgi:SAM-dependent methyltransferase
VPDRALPRLGRTARAGFGSIGRRAGKQAASHPAFAAQKCAAPVPLCPSLAPIANRSASLPSTPLRGPQADAVVSLGTLAPLSPDRRRAVLAEAARVLRPGGALIFVERVSGDRAPASPLRGALTAGAPGGGAALALGELDALRGAGGGVWQGVQYDLALEGEDPHALGVAVRGEGRVQGGGGGASSAAGRQQRQESKRERRKPTNAKGF